jgi:hypothetical protein
VELRRFDGEGRFVRSVGRQGEGPGEFTNGSPCVRGGPNQEVWTTDPRSRFQRFDASGQLVDSRLLPGFNACGTFVMSDGHVLTLTSIPEERYHRWAVLHRLGDTGELIPGDSFRVVVPEPVMALDNRGTPVGELPFQPLSGFTIGPHGEYIRAEMDAYRFELRAMNRDTPVIVEREYLPAPIPAEVRDSAIQRFAMMGERVMERNPQTDESEFSADRVPHVYPAFVMLWVNEDGTIWFARTLESGADGFDVFSEEGRFLGSIASLVSFDEARIAATTRDHIYAVVSDELGIPYVERWSINR